jgi:hypothetical protein
LDLLLLIVAEPDLWSPVDAYNMCPALSAFTGHFLDRTIDGRAQEALDIRALRFLLSNLCASFAVKVAVWNTVSEATTVACLMNSNQAHLTDNNFITFFVV